jgi:hypothetical protein
MDAFGISQEDAELAIAVQDGEHPERYEQIRTGRNLYHTEMFITVIVKANRGDYIDDGIPAWDGSETIGDTLEQRECMICLEQFTPRDDEWMCPTCYAEACSSKYDDADYPIGAVGGC